MPKSAAGRHIILKERLIGKPRRALNKPCRHSKDPAARPVHGFCPHPMRESFSGTAASRGILASDDSSIFRDVRPMTVFSMARFGGRDGLRTSHLLPIALASAIAAGAVAAVAYLLWPTWGIVGADGPERLPISVGGTLFNVPTRAIRMKIQRHSGQQERIDLSFLYPSLEPPGPQKHVSADEVVEEMTQPIDRIFLSIAAHNNSLSPESRLNTIYPRYLEQASTPGQDGLTMRAFRADTPYGGEDLYYASTPPLAARCSRDKSTPGMCLSERRIDGADLTFRFPRSWLAQWQDVAASMDRLTARLHGQKG